MKKFLLFLLIFLPAIFSPSAFAQQPAANFDLSNYGVRIDPDKRVMIVLAALETASLNMPLSDAGIKYREQMQTDLPNIPADLRQKIGAFVAQYKKRHPQATDAQLVQPFVSMAYSLSPAPELADPAITGDLPGDLLDVLDFAPLVREFYRRSGFSGKIDEYVKIYQQAGDSQLRESSKQMVGELLDYLHTRPQTSYTEKIKTQASKAGKNKPTLERIEIRSHERHFYIVPELLLPVRKKSENQPLKSQGTVNLINIRDDYFVIAAPDTDLNFSDARRAFVQFVVDPLVLANFKDISTFSPMIKSLLDAQRKTNPDISPDIVLAVSRSLVAAIDAREVAYQNYNYAVGEFRRSGSSKPISVDEQKKISKLTADLYLIDGKYSIPKIDDEIALRLSEDYKKGAVLDFYFAEQLKGLENSGFDIASSLRDMILSLETAKEDNRLAVNAEAAGRAAETRRTNAGKPFVFLNPVTVELLEIEKLIQSKNYAQASARLAQLKEKNTNEPRIYYTIGRVASFSAEAAADPEVRKMNLVEAANAYNNVINNANSNTDPALLSLTYVALAKIYVYYDQSEYAAKIYDAAIKIGDVPGGAYREALAGKQQLLKNQ